LDVLVLPVIRPIVEMATTLLRYVRRIFRGGHPTFNSGKSFYFLD
jgi:hypothetical protein